MTKPMPLFPGPRPPYVEDLVKKLKDRLDSHESDTDDPHETRKLLPVVYSGTALPSLPADPYKKTDLFVDTSTGNMYVCTDESGSLAWKSVLVTAKDPMSGEVSLDNENDLYDAVQKILEALGATVR